MINEPAYPVPGQSSGMTLRDWFAGMALQGLLASGKVEEATGVKETAYLYADEMLAQREITTNS